MAQAVASMLAGLATARMTAGLGRTSCALGAAGVVLRSLTVWAQAVASRRAALGVKEELRSQLLEHAPCATGRARRARPTAASPSWPPAGWTPWTATTPSSCPRW